ncbi:hypothetical protein BGW38_001940 [Lunasporangiospora selenospora]|uniref:DH domain-containing protein n=1 Tax=Lunasporangiospora selenospora TaxID=979761 RepID=A0A9P6KD78_9FUNG|nr:hypothetical protein BGW38_001940 [Lunasporangiospora selenospora]
MVLHKLSPPPLTSQQQYQAIEQTLARAGYDYEAYMEERPKIRNGSMVFSVLNGAVGNAPASQLMGYSPGGFQGASFAASGMASVTALNMSTGIEPGYCPTSGQGMLASGSTAAGSTVGGRTAGLCDSIVGMNIGIGAASSSALSPTSQPKRYAHTVRSSASSILSLGRNPKSEPPVMILPHYNSPYEAIFYNQPGKYNNPSISYHHHAVHFVGKDLRLGTICISARPEAGVTHFLVRTVLRFVSLEIPDDFRATTAFEVCRSYYPKKSEFQAMLHFALEHCLASVPQKDRSRHQVVRHQSAGDHSVFVLDDAGWMQSPRYIASLVAQLEEIKQEGFSHVLKNLEAQMKPAALTVDFVVPDNTSTNYEQERFWALFNSLGDHIEPEILLPESSRKALSLPVMRPGEKSAERRHNAILELIETEEKYKQRVQSIVDVYMKEAREFTGPSMPGKYELRVMFSNIEQILAVSSNFLKDLREYERAPSNMNLGDICKKNLQAMGGYKHYLMRYSKAQQIYSRLEKKSIAFQKYQEKCRDLAKTGPLGNLLVEPTQRIAKYPLLFKEIVSGTPANSPEVEGLKEAAEMAALIAHMEKAGPEQTLELLFNLRSAVENCPDRSVVAYLDGYDTNLLTGERGKAITLILFSDKVMIVRRPRGMTGEALFRPKESAESEKRRKDKGNGHSAPSNQSQSQLTGSFAQGAAGLIHAAASRSHWKFMGWMDLLKLQISCVEQTDPEGLFCISTRYHAEGKEDLWETTRGILPEDLNLRDNFISKFYQTLTLEKALSSSGVDNTSRLHVAELELFCNVFTESQYKDYRYKGEVALFYAHRSGPPVDVTPFMRLPTFVGMIQSTDAGFRAVLKSRANLNDVGDTIGAAEDINKFMDSDTFGIHLTELVANIQWTRYHFDPYESAQLHYCRVYMETDYFYRTANTFTKAASLRSKGLKKFRESATASISSARSSQAFHQHRHSNSFSSGIANLPGSHSGVMLGRSATTAGNYNHNWSGNCNANGSTQFGSPLSPNSPGNKSLYLSGSGPRRGRADSIATIDSAGEPDYDGNDNKTHQKAISPKEGVRQSQSSLTIDTIKSSVSVMNMLIPGRKKGLLSSMTFGNRSDKKL